MASVLRGKYDLEVARCQNDPIMNPLISDNKESCALLLEDQDF